MSIRYKKQMDERHTEQRWLVGTRVRITKRMESCLLDVPRHRLQSEGKVIQVQLRYPTTPDLCECAYLMLIDSELLGETRWWVIPGKSSFDIEVERKTR